MIESGDGARILIDGGGSASARFDPGKNILSPLLTKNNAAEMAAVINSHPDLDHAGGLFFILDRWKIGRMFHNGRKANGGLEDKWAQHQDSSNAAILANGDRIYLGRIGSDIYLEALHPPLSQPGSDKWTGNGASLILRLVRNGEGIAVFPGDADKNALKKLLGEGRDLRAKIVFAPHHGSDKNALGEFYDAIRPRLVIACCGFWNRYHYPGKKLVEILAKRNIPLANTGENGRIIVTMDEKNKISARSIRNLNILTE